MDLYEYQLEIDQAIDKYIAEGRVKNSKSIQKVSCSGMVIEGHSVEKVKSSFRDKDYFGEYFDVEAQVFVSENSEIVIKYFEQEYELDNKRKKKDADNYQRKIWDFYKSCTLYYSKNTGETFSTFSMARNIYFDKTANAYSGEYSASETIKEIHSILDKINKYKKYTYEKERKRIESEKRFKKERIEREEKKRLEEEYNNSFWGLLDHMVEELAIFNTAIAIILGNYLAYSIIRRSFGSYYAVVDLAILNIPGIIVYLCLLQINLAMALAVEKKKITIKYFTVSAVIITLLFILLVAMLAKVFVLKIEY